MLIEPIVDIRAGRLARALTAFGVGPAGEVVVLCCPGHGEDASVARRALEMITATAVEPAEWSAGALRALAGRNPVAALACEEGVRAWRGVDGRGILIGEGDGVLWWKALECRHAAAAVA